MLCMAHENAYFTPSYCVCSGPNQLVIASGFELILCGITERCLWLAAGGTHE